MLTRRTNTFSPHRVDLAHHAIAGVRVPEYLWPLLKRLWFSAERAVSLHGELEQRDAQDLKAFLASIPGWHLTLLSEGTLAVLVVHQGIPQAIRTGRPALDETAGASDTVLFSEMDE